LVEILAVIL